MSYNYNIKIKLLDVNLLTVHQEYKEIFNKKNSAEKHSKKLIDRKREKSFGGRRIRNEKLRFQR